MTCDVAFDGESLNVSCDDAGDFIFLNNVGGRILYGGFQDIGSSENLTDVKITTRGGGDAVILQGFDIGGDLKIETGDGNDVVTLHDVSVAGDAKIDTGNGSDAVFMGGSFTGPVDVDGDLKIDLGAGNDLAFFQASTSVGGDAKVDGGADVDQVFSSFQLTADGEIVFKDVEVLI